MSRILGPDAFPREEISYGQAIAYLRKEAVTLSDAAPRGVVLLTYKDIPLGFVKNIGNRATIFIRRMAYSQRLFAGEGEGD